MDDLDGCDACARHRFRSTLADSTRADGDDIVGDPPVYGDPSECDQNPTDDVAEFGGRPCNPDAFDRWINAPGTIVFLAVSLVLLLAALAVTHRG